MINATFRTKCVVAQIKTIRKEKGDSTLGIMKIKFYLDILIICMFVSHLYSVAADFVLMQKTNWFSLILSAVCYYQMTNMNTVYPELIEKWKSDLKK